jgi:CubicO group peptidase (beta-lactamase class C family)
MSRPFRRSLLVTFVVLAAALLVVRAQEAAPSSRARAEAYFAALASGDPDQFEAMVQTQGTEALLKRRTPEDRRAMVQRIRDDFGALTLVSIEQPDDTRVTMTVRGATGMEGRLEFETEPTPPYRIGAVSIRAGTGAGTPPAAPGVPISPAMSDAELSKALDAHVTSLAGADAFAGVVLLARDGTQVFAKAYGQANRETKQAAAVTTRFNVGSIGKMFTKTAVAQLVAQGKLKKTDTIGQWLPDYPNAEARVATVDQLLEHQAGIADFFGPKFDELPKAQFRSNDDYYRFVAPQALLFAPGAKRQYCNGCYVVLGAIVARVSGMPYEDYVAMHVFGPAGMKGAGFFQADRLPADVAIGYTRRSPRSPGTLIANLDTHGMAGSGAGGVYASAADLLAFDSALREGRLLDRASTAWVLGSDVPPQGRARGDLGIAGGAPGINAALESDGTWTVAVLANLDPPSAETLARGIRQGLER